MDGDLEAWREARKDAAQKEAELMAVFGPLGNPTYMLAMVVTDHGEVAVHRTEEGLVINVEGKEVWRWTR